MPLLRRVIEKDSFYFYLSEKERNFDPIKREVLKLQGEIKKGAYEDAQKEILKADETLKCAEKFWGEFFPLKEDRRIRSDLKLAKNKVASNDYDSILRAKIMATTIYVPGLLATNKIP